MRLSKSVRRSAGLAGAASCLALLASPSFAADAAHGAQVFKGTCGVCHLAQPHPAVSDLAMRIGPNLWGVVNRPKASEAGFTYSDAIKSKGGNWTIDDLSAFLTNPRTFAPGTKMTFVGLPKGSERADVIAYLNSLSDNPAPLPKAAQNVPAGQKTQ